MDSGSLSGAVTPRRIAEHLLARVDGETVLQQPADAPRRLGRVVDPRPAAVEAPLVFRTAGRESE